MLARLYIDNYKCFQNFELRLGSQHLFIGSNGTGKTTLFEVIRLLRKFALGEGKSAELFPDASRTRWDQRSRQTFEIDVRALTRSYTYRLELDRDPAGLAIVHRERLDVEGKVAVVAEKGLTTFHGSVGKEQSFASGKLSILPFVPEGRFLEIDEFLGLMRSIWSVRADPLRMVSRSEGEADTLAPDLSNFSSWYRSASLERSEFSGMVAASLREIWDDFGGFRSVSAGEGVRILKTEWNLPVPTTYSLDELSEGQRALMGLYAVVHWLEGREATLLLDEPDNFLALREVQPLMNFLSEKDRLQRLIISHHPEVIDLKARTYGLRFERVPEGHVRWSRFDSNEALLRPSEVVARGWENGQ
jgi:energy-coupling factor transporter ATP-binding protein EcfA2